MRVLSKTLVAGLVLCVWVGSVQAQELPVNIGVDSSLRAGFLFGRNMVLYKDPLKTGYKYWRMEFGPQLPLLSGSFELSPFQRLSARIDGSISVIATAGAFHFNAEEPIRHTFDVTPGFKHWEAAGLYHLWTGGGYRFSLVGGFRQEFWKFVSDEDPVGPVTNARFNQDHTSNIPFLGLQTAVFFPWWKARFEFRAAPFMAKAIAAQVIVDQNQVSYRGRADEGGLVEFEVEGTVALAANLRVGLHGRYSYSELYGESERNNGTTIHIQSVIAQESFGLVGLNLTFVF